VPIFTNWRGQKVPEISRESKSCQK
jgi:hypothetical protein